MQPYPSADDAIAKYGHVCFLLRSYRERCILPLFYFGEISSNKQRQCAYSTYTVKVQNHEYKPIEIVPARKLCTVAGIDERRHGYFIASLPAKKSSLDNKTNIGM